MELVLSILIVCGSVLYGMVLYHKLFFVAPVVVAEKSSEELESKVKALTSKVNAIALKVGISNHER